MEHRHRPIHVWKFHELFARDELGFIVLTYTIRSFSYVVINCDSIGF